jgi:hypothetical protein
MFNEETTTEQLMLNSPHGLSAVRTGIVAEQKKTPRRV